MGLVMVCRNGAMPPVNFDPATDNNMTSNLIDQDSFAAFPWACRSVFLALKNKQISTCFRL
jgi:hypothetical protein